MIGFHLRFIWSLKCKAIDFYEGIHSTGILGKECFNVKILMMLWLLTYTCTREVWNGLFEAICGSLLLLMLLTESFLELCPRHQFLSYCAMLRAISSCGQGVVRIISEPLIILPFQAFKHNLDKLILEIFLFYCLNFWFWHSHSNLTCFAMLTSENDLMRIKVCWEVCAASFQKHMGCKSSQ